ncbi:hypothetical protein L6452_17995 [Arctium lappa]|uniref:Uncharacterized protein n=1 Tax=Arctium lappa TaxID=4217 RepID=A0ACB9C556_ARCLA|nr:hypothetical protein L6452_17995 [Arctium lappa]
MVDNRAEGNLGSSDVDMLMLCDNNTERDALLGGQLCDNTIEKATLSCNMSWSQCHNEGLAGKWLQTLANPLVSWTFVRNVLHAWLAYESLSDMNISWPRQLPQRSAVVTRAFCALFDTTSELDIDCRTQLVLCFSRHFNKPVTLTGLSLLLPAADSRIGALAIEYPEQTYNNNTIQNLLSQGVERLILMSGVCEYEPGARIPESEFQCKSDMKVEFNHRK